MSVAVRYNQTDFLKSYSIMVLLGLIPTWSMAAYFSKNLLFDNLLYDSLLVLSGPFIMMALGQAESFRLINWIGIFITFVGLFLVKMK